MAAVGGAPRTQATKTNEDIPALQVRDLKHRATKHLPKVTHTVVVWATPDLQRLTQKPVPRPTAP